MSLAALPDRPEIAELLPGLSLLHSPVWLIDPEGPRILWANPAAAVLDGTTLDEPELLTAIRSAAAGHPATCAWRGLALRVALAGPAMVGRVLIAEAQTGPELVDKAFALEATLQAISQAVSIYDTSLRLVSFNRRWAEILKVPPELARIGTPFEALVRHFVRRGDFGPYLPEKEDDKVARRVARARSLEEQSGERTLWDGTIVQATAQHMEDGRLMFTFADITRLRRSEREIASKSQMLQSTFDSIAQGIGVADREMRIVAWNDRLLGLFGLEPGDIHLGKPFAEIVRLVRARSESRPIDDAELAAEMAAMGEDPFAVREEHTPAGRIVEVRRSPMPDGGMVATYLDVTERLQSERELADREMRLHTILSHIGDGVLTTNAMGRIESWNAAAERIFGYRAEEIMGQPFTCLTADQSSCPPDGRVAETVGRRRDGSEFALEWSAAEIQLKQRPLAIITLRDVSSRKATEERLRQVQKMEAIGQLTGGIAHDFNNLLTVILGNLQWLEDALEDNQPYRRMVSAAIRASSRGAALTQRLLAFSRRQTLKPEPTDLDELIGASAEIFGRTLGETVRVVRQRTPGLGLAMIDRNQFEDALLNLGVNARDAMPKGGTLTLSTSEVVVESGGADDTPPGRYVAVAVADTGGGMTPEVLARAFDPFFTTKEVGRGSGLGLSMVYGFVRQSGGALRIDTEVGRGTRIELLFPRIEGTVQAARAAAEPLAAEHRGRGESVLLVEDHPDVRSIAYLLLEELGYRVVEASDGPSALEILGSDEPIDLMFSDMVLAGGISGARLAADARARRPGLKLLLTSGYASDVVAREGELIEGAELLPKPYSKQALAQRLRAELDRA